MKRYGLVWLITWCAMAVATLAAPQPEDWSLYGSVRLLTVYEQERLPRGETLVGGVRRRGTYDMGLLSTSRVGASVTFDEGRSAWTEVSITEDRILLRHLVGRWRVGEATLTIGQTRTPVGRQSCGRVRDHELGLTAFGEPYLGRRPLLQLQRGGVTVAIVRPHSLSTLLDAEEEIFVENRMPRVEASVERQWGDLRFDGFGGYHTYQVQTAQTSLSVDSYMLGGGVAVVPGPLRLQALGYYARNARQFGQYFSPQPSSFGSARIQEGRLIDNDVWASALIGALRLSQEVSAEIGYGYAQSQDVFGGAQRERWQAYYAQLIYRFLEQASLTPEVGLLEDRDSGQRFAYLAAKWQMDF